MDQLAKQLVEVSSVPDAMMVAARPRDEFRNDYNLIVDICEKLGFLWLAAEEIANIESKREFIDGSEWHYLECSRVKYHVYDCIFNAKAVSDSVSVLLNGLFGFGYSRGEIDFIKTRKFRRDLISRSEKLGEFWSDYSTWFKNLALFRDAVIHRQSIPVFILHPETKVAFDFRPVGVEIVDGKETLNFGLAAGSSGFVPTLNLKFKGSQVIAPWKPSYVMPKDIISYDHLSSKNEVKFDDFQDVLGFCRAAFDRLRGLSEIAFSETLNVITRRG